MSRKGPEVFDISGFADGGYTVSSTLSSPVGARTPTPQSRRLSRGGIEFSRRYGTPPSLDREDTADENVDTLERGRTRTRMWENVGTADERERECGDFEASLSNEATELMALRLLVEEYLKEKDELKRERDELRVQLDTAVENHKRLSGLLVEERKKSLGNSPAYHPNDGCGLNLGMEDTMEELQSLREELLWMRQIEATLRSERSASNVLFAVGLFGCILTVLLIRR